MGVPKFFRFISERYPCLCEVVKEYEIPEFDNFYIDANGIIHNCSHPDDSVHFRISEEEIFKDIFYYLEVLFRLIQPKKLFFIAIDGVAPRAKMNQQRSRRFRTAKDAELALKRAVDKGETLPDTDRFDSNCITPGTVFMDKLHKQLQYFIKHKISTDATWQKPKIILSGHNVPGEGEHKIMDYIRYLRSQSDWDPNTRHCLHGLDADLIMLGLCTHEPHFSLLREEVKFSRTAKKPKNVEETKFFLLHLSMMRGYLDLEFRSLKDKLSFEYDIERIIDDWVLMGFLVGNDFIPNLPKFHIANNALHKLYQAYMEILPTLGGYINDYGTLNLERFEKYLTKLAEIELDNFRDIQADIKYLESKSGKKLLSDETDEAISKFDDELMRLVEDSNKMFEGEDDMAFDSSDDEQLIQDEFRHHKARFYMEKLNYENVDSEVLMSQAECYVRAIQWNLFYYYTGCPSWSWFYPHHYAPYVSDIKGFTDFDFKFDLSAPFQPFQQLLAVLPSASKNIVPGPFQDLMASPDSPIIQFYPPDFETDLNDKMNDWEAVVLIPFIEEKSLLDAMQPYYKDLTEDENRRNSVQPMEVYEYTSDNLGRCEAPEHFPPIENNHAQVTTLSRSDIAIDPRKVVKGILPGALSGARYGFPQLRGISFKVELKLAKVKVFEHPSRGENMILKIDRIEFESEEILYSMAEKLRNKIIYVGWPHIQKGKATAISSEQCQFRIEHNKPPFKYDDKNRHKLDAADLQQRYLLNLGIDLGKVDIIIYVKTVVDIRVQFDENDSSQTQGKRTYMWSETHYPFPYQTYLDLNNFTLIDNDEELEQMKDLNEIFPIGKQVFLMDLLNYGMFGKVKSIDDNKRVEVIINVEPNLDLSGILELSHKTDLRYYPGSIAAQRLGIGSHLFSRLTGSIFIKNADRDERINVGLGLKFTKQGEELIGYTRREGNIWYYSEKTIALLDEYMDKFPELFEKLHSTKSDGDMYLNKDIFPDNTDEKMSEIRTWLKAQSHSSAERRPSGSLLLTSEAMKEIEKRVIELCANRANKTLAVNPSSIYIPKPRLSKLPPDPNTTVNMLDRVIFVRENHCIPLGLMGTVVGVDKPANSGNALYDILFDCPVIGGSCRSCDQPRIYRLPNQSFINISYGARKSGKVNVSAPSKMANVNQTNVGESWRGSNYNNSPRNENKFYQIPRNRELSQPGTPQGNDSVKQFLQNFHPAKQGAFPANHVPHPNRSLGADSEFQAMWNFLQNQKVPEEKSLRPGVPPQQKVPVSPVEVVEQTIALRKFLKLNETPLPPVNQHFTPEFQPQLIQHANNSSRRAGNMAPLNTNNFLFNQGSVMRPKTCSHINCDLELRNLCVNKNIQIPRYNYKHLASSGEITCIITFSNDIGKAVGDSCRNQEEAAENASCKAIKLILKREEIVRSPLGYRNVHRPAQPMAMQPQQSTSRIGMNQQLPIPPVQWCSSRTNMIPDTQFTPPMRNKQDQIRSPQKVLSPVVPNSPQEESRGYGQKTVKNEETHPLSAEEGNQKPKPNQSHRRSAAKAKSRIAANFSVPLPDSK
ncbi:5'-3' exoribonuclease 1 [Halyomorpha halys]|uniref:5'-3' exoribonuclease 1 n=1 Tax=Halyomorpha halys TaxID=286706 RepID=UPI0006D506A5